MIPLSAEHSRRLLNIARAAIIRTLAGEPPVALGERDPAMLQPAGCFVSLHQVQDHRLRGCMGRLDASGQLAAVVAETAVTTLHDPRFATSPVRLGELPKLAIEISVLSPLQNASGPLDFDLSADGIYLTIQGRTGCFLPQVARETGWTKEQLLNRLCSEKMGLPENSWQNADALLQTFSVVILGPEPFYR